MPISTTPTGLAPYRTLATPSARLLIVGLAPAAHGANRTGRMFTGDRSGEWLYRALHRGGFANQAASSSCDDGLELIDCAITAICHCAPPQNKPTREERLHCQPWLQATLDSIPARVYLALGQIAWDGLWHLVRDAPAKLAYHVRNFSHGAEVRLDRWSLADRQLSSQPTEHVHRTPDRIDAGRSDPSVRSNV